MRGIRRQHRHRHPGTTRRWGRRVAGASLPLLVLATAACSPSAPDTADSAARTEWTMDFTSVASVGDSITRGFHACGVLSDCPEVSWATGSDPRLRSLAQRLLKQPVTEENAGNFAKTGASMADLPGQIEAAMAQRPDLVTVLMGANDACQDSAEEMTPVDEFRADFGYALRTVRRASPETRVYVSSIPDLQRLWTEGREDPMARQIWQLGVCPSMLKDPDAMDQASVDRRKAVTARVSAYNEVLRDVCRKDKLCRYDGGAVFDVRFTRSLLSTWDYFHPGKSGQERLAEIAYGKITER